MRCAVVPLQFNILPISRYDNSYLLLSSFMNSFFCSEVAYCRNSSKEETAQYVEAICSNFIAEILPGMILMRSASVPGGQFASSLSNTVQI